MAVFIRLDGNATIGSGHAMRCLSVANELQKLGVCVRFLVSDEDSRAFVAQRGIQAEAVGGNPLRFVAEDGSRLAAAVGRGSVVLVDSYAVTPEFFEAAAAAGAKIAYLDDTYTFERGVLEQPVPYRVRMVLNYGFGFSQSQYEAVYAQTGTKLLIGPRYALVRDLFQPLAGSFEVRSNVERVLVTSGSTNPNGVLERMAAGCVKALPHAQVNVVVGGAAEFDAALVPGPVVEHRNITNMAPLMTQADLVVSAAGTTLYELCILGAPTVAVPIVDNQLINIQGFSRLQLGEVLGLGWTPDDVSHAVGKLAESQVYRQNLHQRMCSLVDGTGAARVAAALKSMQEAGGADA